MPSLSLPPTTLSNRAPVTPLALPALNCHAHIQCSHTCTHFRYCTCTVCIYMYPTMAKRCIFADIHLLMRSIFPESWRHEGYIKNKLPNISRCISANIHLLAMVYILHIHVHDCVTSMHLEYCVSTESTSDASLGSLNTFQTSITTCIIIIHQSMCTTDTHVYLHVHDIYTHIH